MNRMTNQSIAFVLAKRQAAALALTGVLVVGAGCGSTEEVKKPDPKPVEVVKEPTKEEALAALLGDAGQLKKKGDFAAAKTKYEAALQKDPKNVDARLGLAESQIALREHAPAETLLKDLRTDSPDNRQAMMLLGMLYRDTAQYEPGIALYQGVLEKNPHDGAVLNHLIVLYRLSGNYKKAEESCTKLLSRDPDNVDALKNLSLIHYDQGRYALSETIALNSLKLKDTDAALYNNLGMFRVQKGRLPEAMAYFKKSVELDPTLLDPHLNIGAIALRYRDYATASKHYGEAVKIAPRHAQANLGYGLALAGEEKADEAITQLTRAIEIDPKATPAMGELARVHKMHKADLAQAQSWAEKYLEAKGAVKDDDPVKVLLNNVKNEIEAKKMAGQAAAEEPAPTEPGGS
jgi:Tfp pilus assembly protein PilF